MDFLFYKTTNRALYRVDLWEAIYPPQTLWSALFVFIKDGDMRYSKEHNEARLVYKKAYGDIPDGFDIHHKDSNPCNNAPSNLEALSRKDHAMRHVSLSPNRLWGMYAKREKGKKHRWTINQIESWLYQINNNVYW